MTWLFALVVVVALGATAVVATGRGGSMTEVHDDRPDALVPADRPLTAADLRRVRFSTALRGYRAAEVDALLERLADELEQRAAAEEPASGSPTAPGTPEAPPAAP
ncbi:DivIVA domain-containing protein [Nocardioides caldifontis]|uniref:DivIVA domain-containing protein n=1 Tax=Nocardioides caldifontis TaxID=2588938 RepID=UPI0011DF5728|nr:DivIVA domain-containing protein [Nocardioides caldifontis]